jgi:hypothetical protein
MGTYGDPKRAVAYASMLRPLLRLMSLPKHAYLISSYNLHQEYIQSNKLSTNLTLFLFTAQLIKCLHSAASLKGCCLPDRPPGNTHCRHTAILKDFAVPLYN